MSNKLSFLNAILAGVISAGAANAATIAYVGIDTNVDTYADDGTANGWHSDGNAKPLDIDGDNVLGTDGFIYPHASGNTGINNPNRSLPSYFTDTNGVGWQVLTTNGSELPDGTVFLDAPTNASPGANPAQGQAEAWWKFSTSAPTDIIQFTFNANANLLDGQILRVGLLFDAYVRADADALPDTGATMTYTLTQTVGGSATATSGALASPRDNVDAAYFDLTGFADGDTFVINADPSNSPFAVPHLLGVTFDTAIPEPSTALLGGLGLLALLRRRR